MDTKSLIIEVATKLFQQKGFKGVGLNEIIKACNISKGIALSKRRITNRLPSIYE